MTAGRNGAAIVLAVVLSLAGVLLAHGTLVLARAEVISARRSGRVLQAEHAARAAAIDALDPGPTPLTFDSGASAPTYSVAGGSGEVRGVGRIVVISPQILWVEGRGSVGAAVRRGGFLAWQLDPERAVDRLGGVLVTASAAPVSGASGIDASAYLEVPDPEPDGGCAPDSIGDTAMPIVPWAFAELDSTGSSLGLLRPSFLESRADLYVAGVGTPGPVGQGTECVESPWNWGDPGDSSGPCAARMSLVTADDGTVLDGGRGQGVLVGRGDLTLRDTEYFGLVVAQGALRLEGRARITGAAIAAGGAQLGPAVRVVGSRCWLLSSLALPALRVPTAIEPVRWIRLDG